MKQLLPQADALLARARRLWHDHQTRAKADGAALDYGLAEIQQLLAANPLCAYCRMPVAWDASLDHRMPIARSGEHALDNLAVCCRLCQERKGLLTANAFGQLLALLGTWHPRAGSDLLARLRSGGQRYARRRG